MEVRDGYKQTEVGIVPEEWRVSTLGKICTFENGDRGINYPSPSSFTQSGVPFINAGHVTDGHIKRNELNYITRESFERLGSGKVKPGDILFCLRGSLGKFGVVSLDFGEGAIASSLVIVRPNSTTVAGDYLSCYFNSNMCVQMIEKWSGGAAQPNLGAQDLSRFSILIPPTQIEQCAIAEALGDADALIESLEQLLVKKRDLKQGAMQELLTGKKRLPGFSGKWEVANLGSICAQVTTGKLDANAMTPNGQYRFYTCAREYSQIDTYAFDTEALLVSGNGANVGYIHYYTGKFNAYQRTYVLSGFSGSIRFIQHYMREKLADRIRVEVNAGNTPYITRGTLTDMELCLPSTKVEQEAIAQVLTDMDFEIDELEIKVSKARQIKQGMMQELLTGRIRLV